MLSVYKDEINILSKKRVNQVLQNETLLKIQDKLPESENDRYKILKKAIAELLSNIRDKNYDASFGMLRFAFYTNLKDPISEARKQGVFRASKFNFHTRLIIELIDELEAGNVLYSKDYNYINSIKNLLKIAPDVLDLKKKILTAAHSRRNFLKTILAIAETKFNDLLTDDDVLSDKDTIDRLFHRNKESILTSASYIVQIYKENLPALTISDFNHIDESIDHDYYYKLFQMAFAINVYIETEVIVDFYGYCVSESEKSSNFTIFNEEFETAKSYGYLKAYLRRQSQPNIYFKSATAESYAEMLDEIWRKDNEQDESLLFFIKDIPVERIVLKFLDFEYGHKINFFSHNFVFKEEQMLLMSLMDDNYNQDAVYTKIYRDFSCIDIFKLQRVFVFMAFGYRKAYERLKDDGHPNIDIIRKRSVLPVFGKEELVRLFKNTTGKSLSDCEGLIEKLTNREIFDDKVIDLQYKPIIAIEQRYLVMPTLFAYSDIIRSLAISENVHLSVSEKHDFMVKELSNAFSNRGFTVQHDFKFGAIEIDIAAVYGENLFLFECKNPYHPVNDFELRNTYAHLVKGFTQIKKFQERFEDRQSLDQFLRNMNIEPDSIKNIHYGIINANRALASLSKNGIKVFHANELLNFLNTGRITVDNKFYHVWKDEQFHVDDLVSYMSGEVITDDILRFKEPMPFSVSYRNSTMTFTPYQFVLNDMLDFQKKKYRYIEPADSSL
tara:strand:- start:15253 stop:17427 length:2175 start_codon:yes stop_codon:yes gene_type:complete